MTGLPRLLAIMGSGETSPTMTSVHAALLQRMGPPPVPAVLLDTPFGFQENADDICGRAIQYFRSSVGHDIGIASLRNTALASPLELETHLARLAASRYIFAGPGSPSYALRQWLGTPVVEALREKLRSGGCITFASAAAVGLGTVALPVYEVYKVGEEPRWLPGLDVLAVAGIRAAVIPHLNNAEGGTHDTRYCYMGLRRIRILEEQLPDGVDMLGVDEHTACILDLDSGTATVRGRGGVTLRRHGMERRYESGSTVPIVELGPRAAVAAPARSAAGTTSPVGAAPAAPAERAPTPFVETVQEQVGRAEAALRASDPAGVAAALLAIESELDAWAGDTLASDERDRARAALRRLLAALGELAREGAVDPRERVRPLVEGILGLRRRARERRHWDESDRLRDLLVGCGVEIHDTASGGTEWELAGQPPQGPTAMVPRSSGPIAREPSAGAR